MFMKQVSCRWTVWIVAAEGEQVERTRRKTCSRARSEVFVPYRSEALLPGICKQGLARIPYRRGDVEALNFVRGFRRELTQYPES
jgi:hypothetical protein